MIHNVLGQKLRPLISAEAALRRRRAIAAVLLIGTAIAAVLFILARVENFWSWPAVLGLAGGVIFAAFVSLWWADSRQTSVKKIVDQIEQENPDLQAALLTAAEQKPGPNGELGYLQERVVFDAVNHALKNDWVKQISSSRLMKAGLVQLLAAAAFFIAMFALLGENNRLIQLANKSKQEQKKIDEPVPDPLADYEITVNPGDAEVERGSKLIVEAKFAGRIPPDATVVIRDPGEDGAERGRVKLQPGLDELVFAGLITKVDSDAVYRVEFDGEKSDEFNITTFVHPKLEKADATITPPAYAEQETKTIEDTLKVSLLEGSDLAWSMKVNKPVKDAELFGIEDGAIIPLKPSSGDPTVLVASHVPEKTQKFRLHLVDDRERSNKRPPILTVNVKKNLPPKLEFEFPKRDVEVSAIQEMPVEGKVWDDLGVLKAGVTFEFGEKSSELALADAKMAGGKNHPLSTIYNFEEIGAKPRDMVTYHLWAEDLGPDGKPRRTMSDLFFAEVREFEDIFREQESQGGPPSEGEQAGGAAAKLMKLQKEVINANWALLRRYQMGRKIDELLDDTGVVKESQEIAIGQVNSTMEEAEDPELKVLFAEAREFMQKAVGELTVALEKPDGSKLEPALAFEKKAYATLVKARNREHNITRSNEPMQGQGQGQEQEQQLMELEMKQKELRYEEQRMAEEQQPQTPEQKENLEVLARLKELAKRQEAIAKKIKELQNALEEAKTEEEKSELERQLKRLQEEQEQLLRELDEVTEKMDSEQNRANMAEEREKLEETREAVKDASEKLDEGKLADAANSATRAQRELEEVKEDFREKTSKKFADEMKAMRNAVRELAETQEAIGEKLDESQQGKDAFDAANSPAENLALSREIDAQREKLEKVLEQMREISEQSETSEPLLSDALYEGVRESTTSGVENSLAEASQLTRYNRREMAREPERAAARGIEELKKDIEAAAERVLGSEADALRLARSELDELIEKTEAEAERLGKQPGGEQSGKINEGEETEVAENQRRGPNGMGAPEAGTNDDPAGAPAFRNPETGEAATDEQLQAAGFPQATPEQLEERMREQGFEPTPGRQPSPGGKGQEPQPGKGEPQPGDPQMAENGKGDQPSPDGKGPQPGKGKGAGEKSEGEKGQGKGEGKGQPKGELAENGKGEKGMGKGEQPGEGKGEESQGKGKGKGEGKGEGQGKGQQELAQNGQPQPGKGKGSQPGEGEGEGQAEKGEGKGKGKGKGKGDGKGEGEGQGKGQSQGYRQGLAGVQPGGQQSGGGSPNWGGGDDRRNGPPRGGSAHAGKPMFFNRPEEEISPDPITGEGYEEFAKQLGNIEEMIDEEDLRNELAKVSDEARAMRIDYRRDNLPPQADQITTRITNPLVELRNRLTEELAKLDKENPLAPIDRDPVPGEFRELVKKYYEELGSGE